MFNLNIALASYWKGLAICAEGANLGLFSAVLLFSGSGSHYAA
jgi:hypothetical protein